MQDNAKNHLRKYKKIYTTFLVVILVLIIGFAGFQKGFRLTNNLTLGKVGNVVIKIPLPLTSVFIDQSKKVTTSIDNETLTLPFSPRKHSIIISHDGYFPWKKDFTVPSGKIIELNPIFISQNATGEIITKNDPEYFNIRNQIIKGVTPTETTPKDSADKTAKLWLADNAIMVEVGSTTKIVIQPDTIIKNVEFYKNRNDVVIFSTTNTIYAIEVDDLGGQNFMPIYRGQDPTFVKATENTIYVLDADNLMEVLI
jgi:hypothetical protein